MSISRFSCVLAATLFSLAACGSEGPMGEMGEMGDPGPMGTMGTPGTPGTPGQDGDDGAAGTPGTPGTNGTNGNNGQACWDLNNNGTCDLGTEDTDDDNACDVADCAGPQGPAGTPGTPGTSGTAGQRAVSSFGTAQVTLAPSAASAVLIPGLTQTITVPAGMVAFISSDGGISTVGGSAADAFALVEVGVVIDGSLLANGGYAQVLAANAIGGVANWSFSVATPITAGNHTISVFALPTTLGVDAVISGGTNQLRQGTLTVMLLKL